MDTWDIQDLFYAPLKLATANNYIHQIPHNHIPPKYLSSHDIINIETYDYRAEKRYFYFP